jgi:hypothetical protein
MKSCCNHTGRGDRDELRLSALTMTLRPVSFVELYFTARKGTSADHGAAAQDIRYQAAGSGAQNNSGLPKETCPSVGDGHATTTASSAQDADGKQMHSDFYRRIDYPQQGVV